MWDGWGVGEVGSWWLGERGCLVSGRVGAPALYILLSISPPFLLATLWSRGLESETGILIEASSKTRLTITPPPPPSLDVPLTRADPFYQTRYTPTCCVY